MHDMHLLHILSDGRFATHSAGPEQQYLRLHGPDGNILDLNTFAIEEETFVGIKTDITDSERSIITIYDCSIHQDIRMHRIKSRRLQRPKIGLRYVHLYLKQFGFQWFDRECAARLVMEFCTITLATLLL